MQTEKQCNQREQRGRETTAEPLGPQQAKRSDAPVGRRETAVGRPQDKKNDSEAISQPQQQAKQIHEGNPSWYKRKWRKTPKNDQLTVVGKSKGQGSLFTWEEYNSATQCPNRKKH